MSTSEALTRLSRLRRARPDVEMRPPYWRAALGVARGFMSPALGSVIGHTVQAFVTDDWSSSPLLELPLVLLATSLLIGAASAALFDHYGRLSLVDDKFIITRGSLESAIVIPWQSIDIEWTRRHSPLDAVLGIRHIRRVDGKSVAIPRLHFSDDAFEAFLDGCERHARSR